MKIIFVYNAESGKLNALFDIAHKIINPETYQCSLCSITHDALSEKKVWTEFKTKTNHELEFFHKDEFEQRYEQTHEYPVILEKSDSMKILINAEEISTIRTVEELIKRIEQLET